MITKQLTLRERMIKLLKRRSKGLRPIEIAKKLDAPAASVSNDEIVDHAEAVMKAVIGDGKAIGGNTNGLVGELQKAQTGPSTGAAVVINTRG